MSIADAIPTFPTLPALITHHSSLKTHISQNFIRKCCLLSCKYAIIDFSFRYRIDIFRYEGRRSKLVYADRLDRNV